MSISQIFPITGAPAPGLTKPWLPAQVSSLLVDTTFQLPTGAANNYVLVSNAVGLAHWAAPSVLPITPVLGYAEFVQQTQGTNASIAPGSGVAYLTDNPTGVYNTTTIVAANNVPGGQGTSFLLPVGSWAVDFESSGSSGSGAAFAIYKSATLGTIASGIDNNTVSGSSTSTTWIHGRAIVVVAVPTYIMISPVVATVSIPTAGPATGLYTARINFLQISS